MAYAEWNSSLETGNGMIDDQNRKLFGMIDELHVAIAEHAEWGVSKSILIRLVEHTTAHFVREEQFMDTHRYSECIEHQFRHQELRFTVAEIQLLFLTGEIAKPLEVLTCMRNRFQSHIYDCDTRMIEFMSEMSPA